MTPAHGSATNSTTPTLSGTAGTAAGDAGTITVKIYSGSTATGTPVQTLTATATAGAWSVAATALAQGTYTALAQQSDAAGNTGLSTANTFVVDTIAPNVTLVTPANGSSTNSATPTFNGTAGTAAGDAGTITVKVYSGSTATGTPVQTLTATATAGAWSVAATALAQGTYTALAQQSDAAGNTSFSTANTFVVNLTAPAATVAAPVVPLTASLIKKKIGKKKVQVFAQVTFTDGHSQTIQSPFQKPAFTKIAVSIDANGNLVFTAKKGKKKVKKTVSV